MIDLLLPSTDAGAVAQLALVVGLGTAGAFLFRKHPDVRLLAIGLTILLVALIALRAVH